MKINAFGKFFCFLKIITNLTLKLPDPPFIKMHEMIDMKRTEDIIYFLTLSNKKC